jgi:hypothetical protein
MPTMTETSDLILSELRELRSDVNENTRQTGERLSALEVQMRSLCGNGQPGRITNIETEVKELAAWRWKMLGICSGASGVISIVGYLIFHQ